MKTWSDSIVTLTVQMSKHLGPVTNLIDGMTDRLLGKHEAQACLGAYCGSSCTDICNSQLQRALIIHFSTFGDCLRPTCQVLQQCGC